MATMEKEQQKEQAKAPAAAAAAGDGDAKSKKKPKEPRSSCVPFAKPADLTQEERRLQVCLYLSQRIKGGRLEKGAMEGAAAAFGLKYNGVRGIFVRNKEALLHPEKYKLDVSRKAGSGRNTKYTPAEIEKLVQAAGPDQSIRTLSEQTGVSKSTLHRIMSSQKGYKRKNPGNASGVNGKKGKKTAGEKKDAVGPVGGTGDGNRLSAMAHLAASQAALTYGEATGPAAGEFIPRSTIEALPAHWGYGQPGYGQPGYGQPGYGQPGFGGYRARDDV